MHASHSCMYLLLLFKDNGNSLYLAHLLLWSFLLNLHSTIIIKTCMERKERKQMPNFVFFTLGNIYENLAQNNVLKALILRGNFV